MSQQRKIVLLAIVVGFAAMLSSCFRPTAPAISVLPAGTTNGIVGIANGVWSVYCVTNQTTDSFFYAGAKIELKTSNGWIVDPALTPTDVGGWIAPPTRAWHDGRGVLRGGGTFHVFFNAPTDGSQWRAALRFYPDRRSSALSMSLTTNPAASAALVEAALSTLDRSRPCDYAVPAPIK
jgi:hypothetical protein